MRRSLEARSHGTPAARGRSARARHGLTVLAAAQALLGARVVLRLARTAHGVAIRPAAGLPAEAVTVLVPVLDERERLGPCLEGLLAHGDEVAEVLVVDCGSRDGTQELVGCYAARDGRLRLIEAGAPPGSANGKAWALQAGLEQARSPWVLTVDADVRSAPLLARSLIAHAERLGLSALSVATCQEIGGPGEAIVHPALLSTLVYRFGIPGGVARSVSAVQSNGQCFLARRDLLCQAGGFAAVSDSICEDVTLGRLLVSRGVALGFFEAPGLVSVRMYQGWRATLRNWPRSLPMRDRYFGISGALGLLEVLLVQALPLPLFVALRQRRSSGWPVAVNLALALTRLGVLAGTARAYPARPWSYWLSPLADLPAALALVVSALRRRHVWRGRAVTRGTRPGGRS